jgi:hypothetical protein
MCSGSRAGDPREVDHRVAGGEPLDEQDVVPVQDAELRMVADDGVQVLEVGHRRVPQRERERGAGGQLPHPDADPHLPVGSALEQPVLGQFGDEPGRRRDVQACPAGDL